VRGAQGFNRALRRRHGRKRFYVALEAAGIGSLRIKEHPIAFHDLRRTLGIHAVQAFPMTSVMAMKATRTSRRR
jgi:hypothetical protein